jgi:hypothetical protein
MGNLKIVKNEAGKKAARTTNSFESERGILRRGLKFLS